MTKVSGRFGSELVSCSAARKGCTIRSCGVCKQMADIRLGTHSRVQQREIRLVGLEQFDQEHRQLATYIGQLQECVIHQRPASHVISILRSVYSYALEHFRHEEQAMESWGYPGLEEHKIQHQTIAGRLARLLEDASVGGTVLSSSVSDILVDWIIEHVEHYDVEYANYYNKGHIDP